MHQRYRGCVSMRYHGARGMSEFLDFSRSVKKCGFTKWHRLSLERTEQMRKESERTDGDFCDSRTLRHLFNMGRMGLPHLHLMVVCAEVWASTYTEEERNY